MKLEAGLWQQQTLKLTMTQELSQAIALLQYNSQELSAFLEDKALENPLLQVESGNVQVMDPRYDRAKPTKKRIEKDKQNWIEQIGRKDFDLGEYLKSQIDADKITNDNEKVLDYLIACIDENGYVRAELKEIADRFQISEKDVNESLKLLQGLEPAGIGARNLQECLYLQINSMEPKNLLAEEIIKHHFKYFAEKKWKEIAKVLNVKMSDIQAVFDFVQTLNPRPAAALQNEKASYIIPDVVIKWDGEAFFVSVFDEVLPKVSFNSDYYQKFSENKDKQVSRFLQENQKEYQWIVKSLEQRKETLIKVSMKIVEKQQEFFVSGPANLRPMTMKEIADELDIHESTVSRAVRGKYAQTPFGTFELRSFFSNTIKTTSDENTSSKQVKSIISKLIDGENKQKPYSDQAIVQILEEQEGLIVSRRTIAKYRDQLGIPSSSKRKRYD